VIDKTLFAFDNIYQLDELMPSN